MILSNPATAILAGTVTATTTPAGIGAAARARELIVRSRVTNTVDVIVSNGVQLYFALAPGDAMTLGMDDVSKVFVSTGSGTAEVDWIAEA